MTHPPLQHLISCKSDWTQQLSQVSSHKGKSPPMAISKRKLLDFQISIVFPFSIPTSIDICKLPRPEDTEKSIGVGLSCFLQELASIAAAASYQLVRAVIISYSFFSLLPFICLIMKILVAFISLFGNNTSAYLVHSLETSVHDLSS